MKNYIYQNINHKNKNCKNDDRILKKRTNSNKNNYKQIKPTKIDKQVSNMFMYPPEIFPDQIIIDNKQYLLKLSKNLADKINNNYQVYRKSNSDTLIEIVAKDCAYQIIKQDKVDIEEYINNRYKFSYFFKKELKFLPYLIMQELLICICKIKSQLNNISAEIQLGSDLKKYNTNLLTNATVYGIFKFNKNLLKFNRISINYVKKCVFNLITKLNSINLKLRVLINYIKYFNNSFCKL